MRVKAQLIAPVGQSGKIILPEPELRPAREVNQVIVAAESPLGGVGDVEGVMARSAGPEDVVLQVDILAVVDDLHRIRIEFHHGVVGQREGAVAGLHVVQPDAPITAVVDQAVGNGIIAVEALALDAGVVVISDDAADGPGTVTQIEASAEVAVGAGILEQATVPTDAGIIAPTGNVMYHPGKSSRGR